MAEAQIRTSSRLSAAAAGARRWLPPAILLSVGSIVAPKPAEQGLFERGAATIAESLLIGAAFSVALLLLAGGLLAAISQAHRRRQTFVSGAAVALAAGLLAATAAARLLLASTPKTVATPTAAAARRTREARAWSLHVSGPLVALRAPSQAAHSFLAHPTNTPQRRRGVARERARTTAALRRLRAVRPPPIPPIAAADRQLLQFATLILDGYDRLAAALAENAGAGVPLARDPAAARLIHRARADLKRARSVGRALGPRLYALNRLFYGT